MTPFELRNHLEDAHEVDWAEDLDVADSRLLHDALHDRTSAQWDERNHDHGDR